MDAFEVDSARFWNKVDQTSDCWNWTAAKSRGYGMIRAKMNGKSRMVLAHRLSFAIEHGPVPSEKQVDHVCHNKACVRPAHLRLVTNKQNSENVSAAQVNSMSGVRGVGWDGSRGMWRARVTHNWKTIHVGWYDNLEKAERAATARRRELFTHSDMDAAAFNA